MRIERSAILRITPCDQLKQGLSSVWSRVNSLFLKTERSENRSCWRLPTGRQLLAVVGVLAIVAGVVSQVQTASPPFRDKLCYKGNALERPIQSDCISYIASGAVPISRQESFTPSEIREIKKQFETGSEYNLLDRMLTDKTEEIKEIFLKMGESDFTKYRLRRNNKLASLKDPDGHHIAISETNELYLGHQYIYALNPGWEDEITREEARGIIAHEVAHRLLKHPEKSVQVYLNLVGIRVENLDNLQELIFDLADQGKISLKDLNSQMRTKILKKHPNFFRNQEEEADQLTLKHPPFAQGVIKYLTRKIKECGQNRRCLDKYSTSDSHPSAERRIRLLRQPLRTP